jgi:beta-lactam-binding protein with PASTA domain/tRNA A-37 threonylcarbamoyl transferase component Bud32
MQGVTRDTIIDERYRVLDRIGSGGMADVYCAEDTELGRKVAIKLLYRRFAEDDEFVQRFRREASAAAGLQHPNVVQVYDRGEWDDTYYIAMEFLDGRSLKQIIREEGPLAPDRAIDIVLQVLRAERFAHKRGIVHRDIKPHNVIVDEEGRANVTDFGIARAGASDMTETGSILGTAQYLSPEQAQGHPVSARSDLYSTGILLYECLTGRVPFDGESPVTIALKQVSEEPIPPSQLNPAVSPALEDVVLHAMAKDPAWRFADADEFMAALEAARSGPPTGTYAHVGTGSYPAVPYGAPAALEEPDRRNRRWLLWLLLALAIVGAGIAAYFLLQPDQRTVPDVVGQKSATAAQRLQDAGFEVSIQPVVSDSVNNGLVISQDPGGHEKADEGSTVKLRVSSGPGEVPIPQVEGLTQKSAEGRLEKAGFKTKTRQEISDSVEQGRVISSTPAEGTLLQKGQTVTLVVSSGPRQVAVPDLVGKDSGDATDQLTNVGLEASISERETTDEDPGTVLEQDPAAGTKVAKGSQVKLVVAKAPPEVRVPEVVDQQRQDARDALHGAGFRVKETKQTVTDPAQDGVVLQQDPEAGGTAKKGTVVTIVVGKVAATPTPSPSPTP